MLGWLYLLIPSVIIGFLCACFIQSRLGVFLAGAIPWFGLLAYLLFVNIFFFIKVSVHQCGPLHNYLVEQ